MHDVHSTIGTTPVQINATARERRRVESEVSLPYCDSALGQATVLGPHRERVRYGSSGPTLGVIALDGFFPPVSCLGLGSSRALRCIGVLMY